MTATLESLSEISTRFSRLLRNSFTLCACDDGIQLAVLDSWGKPLAVLRGEPEHVEEMLRARGIV